MNPYRILVPTDFSHQSDAALALATSVARDHTPACIYLVHVREEERTTEQSLGVHEPEGLLAKARRVHLQREPQVPLETLLVLGDPAAEIVNVVNAKHVDLVVMGVRDRAAADGVAETVTRLAACPVMTVKADDD
jgi:nucleotide-binding universal stress UspA family protein